jgi:hypothetical protein
VHVVGRTVKALHLAYGSYRVRARDARIRAMQHRHQNRSISNEAIEPPTTNIII